MTIDIALHIEKLLYDNDSVIIPDFGGFVSKYKPASIDHVQGMLYPPSNTILFNENLVVNDGILVNYVRETNNLSLDEAKHEVRRFVNRLKASLAKREIIVFPGVGRLYRDYERKLQFLPDNTNFNLDSFGLPSVQYYPVLRTRETASKEAPLPVLPNPATITRSKGSWFGRQLQSGLPILFGLAMVFIAFSIYFLQHEEVVEQMARPVPVSETRINQKPTRTEAGIYYDDYLHEPKSTSVNKKAKTEDFEEIEEQYIEEMEAVAKEEIIKEETYSIEPSQKTCIVIVGQFKMQSGVNKRIKQLTKLGFIPYTDDNKGLTRVGAQFMYDDRAVITKNLKKLRKKFDKHAWVLKE